MPRVLLLLVAAAAALLLACPHAPTAHAAVHDGTEYSSSASWKFVEKFCFDNTDAGAAFTLVEDAAMTSGAVNTTGQYILFYSDQDWSDVNTDDLTCQQKVALARQKYSISSLGNMEKVIPVSGSVPRWWYVAFSNCGSGDALDATAAQPVQLTSWKMAFTNQAGTFERQFSMDEQGILEMSIFFAALFFILMVILVLSVCLAKKKGQTAVVMQLVFLSMVIEFIALAFSIAHRGKYSDDGRGVTVLDSLWFFFDFVSNLVLVFVVVCISGGWNKLSKVFATVAVVGLLGLYVALYVWIHEIRHGWETTYDYETGLGWAIVGVRGALTIYVLLTSVLTYLRTRAKFYLVWVLFAVCWMVSLCVFVGIAHTFEAWKRRRMVFGLMASVQAAIYIILICFFFGGDGIATTTPKSEREKERERVANKERALHSDDTGAAAVEMTPVVPEKRLDVDADEHSEEHTAEGAALTKAPSSTKAATSAKAAAAATPVAAVVPASDKTPRSAAASEDKTAAVAAKSPLATSSPHHVASSSSSQQHYSVESDDHVTSHGQMDYSSVFALKQNVLERPKHTPQDDEADENEVHFVLHQ